MPRFRAARRVNFAATDLTPSRPTGISAVQLFPAHQQDDVIRRLADIDNMGRGTILHAEGASAPLHCNLHEYLRGELPRAARQNGRGTPVRFQCAPLLRHSRHPIVVM